MNEAHEATGTTEEQTSEGRSATWPGRSGSSTPPERSSDATAETTLRPCPYCAEQIQDRAVLCRFCGSSVVALSADGEEQHGDEGATEAPDDSRSVDLTPRGGDEPAVEAGDTPNRSSNLPLLLAALVASVVIAVVAFVAGRDDGRDSADERWCGDSGVCAANGSGFSSAGNRNRSTIEVSKEAAVHWCGVLDSPHLTVWMYQPGSTATIYSVIHDDPYVVGDSDIPVALVTLDNDDRSVLDVRC